MVDTGMIRREAERAEQKKQVAHMDTRYAMLLEQAVIQQVQTKDRLHRPEEETEAAREAAETFLLGVLRERGFTKLASKYSALKAKTPF